MTETKTVCACGSGANYGDCCGRYHVGPATAPTAEALMRSRYCAYVLGLIDYLVATTLPAVRTTDLWISYQSTHKTIQWIGLEVVAASQGGAKDKTGKVEFKASYVQDGISSIHHEWSRFRRSGGAWYYVDGTRRSRE